MNIKTIDIKAKEWFDKVNGNSYFAANVTVNYGMEDSKELVLPYQYGYGNHYVDMGFAALEEAGIITDRKHYTNGSGEPLWNYCDRNNIILRTSKQENCRKRELKAY